MKNITVKFILFIMVATGFAFLLSGAGFADENLGTTILNPSSVEAGANQTITLNYTVETPINTSGGIKIYFGANFEHLKDGHIQNDSPDKPGYVQITTNSSAALKVNTSTFGGPQWGTRLSEITVLVQKDVLNTGDTVTIIYSNAYVQETANKAEVTVLVNTGDGLGYREIKKSPVLIITPVTAHKLIAAITPDNGLLKISAVDRYGNLATAFNDVASINLVQPDNQSTFIGTVSIKKGRTRYKFPTDIPQGYYVIKIETSDENIQAAVPYAPGHQNNVYFGDLHLHTRLSDAYVNIDPRSSYAYARKTAVLDFVGISDHAEEIVKNKEYTQFLVRDIPDSWEEIKAINADFNSEGNFITFLGYETTSDNSDYPRDGHVNVYYKGYNGNIYPHHRKNNDVPSRGIRYFNNTNELFDRLRQDEQDGIEAIAIPHHTLYYDPANPSRHAMGNDFYYYDQQFSKGIEIYSHHGCSEAITSPSALSRDKAAPGAVQSAIGELGYNVGVLGGSDNHFGRPAGTGIVDPKHGLSGGLTAVISDSLTKDSLWSAISSGATYATSGERIYLKFEINGAGMGSKIKITGKPDISGIVIGTRNIIKVELLKYDSATGWKVIDKVTPRDSLFCFYIFKDIDFIGNSIYYLRVQQQGFSQAPYYYAWSSPIWVNKAEK